VSYEKEMSEIPGPSRVASTATTPPDYPNNIARPTEAQLQLISDYLRTTYGFETGPYQGYAFESPGERFTAKIDWNISQNHKFNMRYTYQQSKDPRNPSTSYSSFSGAQVGYTGNRQAMDAMWFKNSGYFQESNFSSFASELNSFLVKANTPTHFVLPIHSRMSQEAPEQI
jgi:hypothetical protein